MSTSKNGVIVSCPTLLSTSKNDVIVSYPTGVSFSVPSSSVNRLRLHQFGVDLLDEESPRISIQAFIVFQTVCDKTWLQKSNAFDIM